MIAADRLALLIDALHRAMKLDFKLTNTFSLGVVEGYYCPTDFEAPQCHPLETVLLGFEATGDPRSQIAAILGEDISWVNGFMDSYSGLDPILGGVGGERYTQGYEAIFDEQLARFLRLN